MKPPAAGWREADKSALEAKVQAQDSRQMLPFTLTGARGLKGMPWNSDAADRCRAL